VEIIHKNIKNTRKYLVKVSLNNKSSIDEKDKALLKVLRSNSRASLRELGTKTKMRPSTVFLRLRRLQKLGVITQYSIRTNPELLNENFVGFVLVSTEGEIDSAFFKNHNLKEAYGVTGEYDLLLKFRYKDVSEFNNALLEFRKQKGIVKTLTMVATIQIKEEL
jgi:DNA-binding Lrp family transcriptional regulator